MDISMTIDRLAAVSIGRVNDGDVTRIRIDCSRWLKDYPFLTDYQLQVTAPNGYVYFPASVKMDGRALVWTVTQSDTAHTGDGMMEVVAVGKNGQRKTSDHVRVMILDVMPGTASEAPPDPARPWVGEVMNAAYRAEEAAKRAENAAGGVEVTPEQVKQAVDDYLTKNPLQETDPNVPEWARQPNPPAPYVLPTASADTKGGVKIGGGLQMDGDVLGVDKELTDKIDALSEENAKTETALANMTVEGFRRVGGYENVKDKAELHAGKFVSTGDWDSSAKKTKIKFFDSAAFNYYALTVADGERYKIKTWCGGTLYGCFLVNATEHIIADYPKPKPSVADNYEIEITIPSGVTTLYVNETVSQAGKFYIEKENLSVPKFEKIDDHLYGKKLACVGDSITEATNPDGGYFVNYAELVAARHNMTVYKDGKGGSTMTNIESNIPPFSAERYLNVPSDFDILTIWFGWNDSAYATVGAIDDTEDTTFYGAYKKVLDYFITTYPTKKIGLIVPYGNASVEPFRVAVRAMSEMYGVPCLDLADGKQCSLLWGMANDAQLARRAALTYDGTHPNQVGHEYLSTMYEEFIKRI